VDTATQLQLALAAKRPLGLGRTMLGGHLRAAAEVSLPGGVLAFVAGQCFAELVLDRIGGPSGGRDGVTSLGE
jgi:hypothetical protein